MEAKIKEFTSFDWTDERWHKYLGDLYPEPNYRQVLKFKKKWYKKNIDPEFDDTWEPAVTSSTTSTPSTSYVPPQASAPPFCDDRAWAHMGSKAMLCLFVYLATMIMSIASVFGVFSAQRALIFILVAFVIEILSKHGFRFSKDYLQTVLLEDVGMMPFLSGSLLMPGNHHSLAIFGLIPSFMTALMSAAQICKACPTVPGILRKTLSPLADISVRYQMMQMRSDGEVGLGFVFVIGAFYKLASPIAPLLYLNILVTRYGTSAWTQASFRKIDGMLNPVLGKIPLVNNAYAKLKSALSAFADPARRSQGSSCSVL